MFFVFFGAFGIVIGIDIGIGIIEFDKIGFGFVLICFDNFGIINFMKQFQKCIKPLFAYYEYLLPVVSCFIDLLLY